MISERMKALVANSSAIRAMFEEGKLMAKKYGSENVYDFSIGNPNVEPPRIVEEAIIDVLKTNRPIDIHGYTNNAGDEGVRQKLAEHINKLHNTEYDYKNFVLSAGAAAAMNVIFKTLLNPGDEVIVFAPYFGEYLRYAGNYDGKVVEVRPNPDNFLPDLEDFRAKITSRTKAVILNTPNNPTGAVYPEDTIIKIAEILTQKQNEFNTSIYILSDEPYRDIVYGGVKLPFVPRYYKNTFVTFSYSKSLSLPGERIGYALINKGMDGFDDIAAGLNVATRILGFVNAPSIMQRVLPYCLGATVDISIYEKNMEIFYDMLKELGFECTRPGGAFYLFPKALIEDDKEFCGAAKEFRLLIVPGASFGYPGHFRAAYCVSRDTIVNSYDSFKKLAEKYRR